MVMYISYRSEDRCPDRIWHVGNPKPSIEVEDVGAIQADGHELELILEHFVNIPHSKGRVQRWKGEFARFIFDNFPFRR